jgi:deoxyribodipyrimidine photolyase
VTGFPLVDAAMRQLWAWGWMPNYMRHVVAGFLVEFLNMDWRHGERWFHDTLVDADVAINAYMWQNGGHSGCDQWNFVMHPVFAVGANPVVAVLFCLLCNTYFVFLQSAKRT